MACAPADERAASGDQLRGLERLDHVVVRPGVEQANAVGNGIPGRQHENRDVPGAGAQLREDTLPLQARQHQVEHDKIVRRLERQPEAVLPVVGHVDGEPGVLQQPLKGAGQVLLILHDEHAHRPCLSSCRAARTRAGRNDRRNRRASTGPSSRVRGRSGRVRWRRECR